MFLDTSTRFEASAAHRRSLPAGAVLALVFSAGLVAGAWLPQLGLPAHQRPDGAVSAQRELPALSPRAVDIITRHSAQVLRVIDGDTFEARVHLWQGLEITTHVRLRGIDAPELKARCAGEAHMAQAAREALIDMLDGGNVTIFNVGPDKYNGRVVADAATRMTPNVSAALIAAGHGRPYGGGRRAGWCG